MDQVRATKKETKSNDGGEIKDIIMFFILNLVLGMGKRILSKLSYGDRP